MKKIIFLFAISIVLVLAILYSSNTTSAERTAVSLVKADSIPDSVKVILVKSCFDCHSDKSSNGFAKNVLNFNKWNTYKPNDQEKYKSKICDKITTDTLPPSGYISKNPQLKLTDKDKKTICDWAKPVKK
jgi:uncharacterized membrane protein